MRLLLFLSALLTSLTGAFAGARAVEPGHVTRSAAAAAVASEAETVATVVRRPGVRPQAAPASVAMWHRDAAPVSVVRDRTEVAQE